MRIRKRCHSASLPHLPTHPRSSVHGVCTSEGLVISPGRSLLTSVIGFRPFSLRDELGGGELIIIIVQCTKKKNIRARTHVQTQAHARIDTGLNPVKESGKRGRGRKSRSRLTARLPRLAIVARELVNVALIPDKPVAGGERAGEERARGRDFYGEKCYPLANARYRS